MKALIGVVVVAAIAAAIWFGLSYRLDAGVSPARPLGDFAKLDKELTGRGLRKDVANPREVKSFLGDHLALTDDMTSTCFTDRVPGVLHQVIVVRTAAGKVVGVASRFRSGSFTYSTTGTAVENFTALYWTALAGKEPTFTKESEGGADGREYLIAKLARGSVEGSWRKEGASASLMAAQEMSDTVVFAAK